MSELQMIPVGDLFVDQRYQKDARQYHYRKIARNFSEGSLGVITVNRREDGTMAVIDGQHRILAMLELEMTDKKVRCDVYDGLSLSAEAAMFRGLNMANKPTAWDDYKAGLVEGDQECIDIDNIAQRAGYRVTNTSGKGKVICVSTLRQIFKYGSEILRKSLEDARGAWGPTPDSVERSVLHGLAILHRTFGEEIDRTSLRKKIGSHAGGARGVLGFARQLKEVSQMPLYKACAVFMLRLYNKGKRGGALSESEI